MWNIQYIKINTSRNKGDISEVITKYEKTVHEHEKGIATRCVIYMNDLTWTTNFSWVNTPAQQGIHEHITKDNWINVIFQGITICQARWRMCIWADHLKFLK